MAGVVAKSFPMADRFADKIPQGAKSDALKNTFLGKNILFYIERSENNNAVIYEANFDGDKLDEKTPVKVYWIMYAKETPNEEGLNLVERNTAYGSSCVKDTEAGDGNYVLTLAALKDRKIKISLVEGVPSAKAEVNGSPEELVHIHVQTKTSWGMPSVDYIDITGRQADGALVTERKQKK